MYSALVLVVALLASLSVACPQDFQPAQDRGAQPGRVTRGKRLKPLVAYSSREPTFHS
jgi:hypothetical protein